MTGGRSFKAKLVDKNMQTGKMNNENSATGTNSNGSKILISPETIERFRRGSHRAFESLFNLFYGRVKTFINGIIKNDDQAEELTQEVFVDLWINREKIDPQKNINAYIYTMARNGTLTAMKQQLKFEITEFDYEEEMDTVFTDDELIAKETELLVNLIVSAMPAKRKLVYEMSRKENKSNEEIAKELNISRKVVEKHIRLAIKELKEKLELILLLFFI